MSGSHEPSRMEQLDNLVKLGTPQSQAEKLGFSVDEYAEAFFKQGTGGEKKRRGVLAQKIKVVPLDHIAHGFLTKGDITILTAVRGSGKTTSISEIVVAAETGGEFFGGEFKFSRPIKTLVVIAEGRLQDIKEKTETKAPDIGYVVLDSYGLSPDELKDEIAFFVGRYGIELVIFDSFGILTSRTVTDENSSVQTLAAMEEYLIWACKKNLAVLATLHASFKNPSAGSRGSSSVEDFPAHVYYQHRVEQDGVLAGVKLTHEKSRHTKQRKPFFLELVDNQLQKAPHLAQLEDKGFLEKKAQVEAAFDELDESDHEHITVERLAQTAGVAKRTLQRWNKDYKGMLYGLENGFVKRTNTTIEKVPEI